MTSIENPFGNKQSERDLGEIKGMRLGDKPDNMGRPELKQEPKQEPKDAADHVADIMQKYNILNDIDETEDAVRMATDFLRKNIQENKSAGQEQVVAALGVLSKNRGWPNVLKLAENHLLIEDGIGTKQVFNRVLAKETKGFALLSISALQGHPEYASLMSKYMDIADKIKQATDSAYNERRELNEQEIQDSLSVIEEIENWVKENAEAKKAIGVLPAFKNLSILRDLSINKRDDFI